MGEGEAVPYVSVEAARAHTRSHGVPDDADLLLKIAQAEAIVWAHLKRPGVPPWNTTTDPMADPEFAQVYAATLIVLANLYRFRGDEVEAPLGVPMAALDILSMLRDPTVA